MDFTTCNIRTFIEYIITFNCVEDVLKLCKTQSERGLIFERTFDVIIKFGFCDLFPNAAYRHMIGNVNKAKLKVLTNLEQYVKGKVFGGNNTGVSDITIQNKKDGTFIFISSKYPKNGENKTVEYYDLQNIIAMAHENAAIYKQWKLYLVVPVKKSAIDKFMRANDSSKYITDRITRDTILDREDLNRYFTTFKRSILTDKNINFTERYLQERPTLALRFHQELITQKTCKLIEAGRRSFLWGCKCRSGKTYMTGGLILKQKQIKKILNVLIITPAPTETITQFTDDLFHKFKDFDAYGIHNVDGTSKNVLPCADASNIFIASKQLLQRYVGDATIDLIRDKNLDIIFVDENHYSGTTDLAKKIYNSYITKNTTCVYLTATYSKPLTTWNVPKECQMYWDIEDEQICKKIYAGEPGNSGVDSKSGVNSKNVMRGMDRLQEKHGSDYVKDTIKFYKEHARMSEKDIFACYTHMPDLHIITNMFDRDRYDALKESLGTGSKFGFCFETLFALNKSKTQFLFELEVRTMLRYISGSQKESDGDAMLFPRACRLCADLNSRAPFTQIWFLPPDNINVISLCLKNLMNLDSILKNYDILCINRKNKDLARDVKDEITLAELTAKSRGRSGVILLAGSMLTLGITLDLCDVVLLLNNSLSSDKVMQQMYRCMTEGKDKKLGIVVDLNISRVLNTCINSLSDRKSDESLSLDNKIKYLIDYHLINIDIDMLLNKKINSDDVIKKLLDMWKTDPVNNFRTLLKKIDDDCAIIDNSTQKLINKTFAGNATRVKLQVIMKDSPDDLQELPSGKECVEDKTEDAEDKTENCVENCVEKEIAISFTKDVLPYIIPLTCILTMKNEHIDFIKMLNDIKDNSELLDIFDDQCLIWWNKKDLINLVQNIVNKFFKKNSNTFSISLQFKLSLRSLIDRPKELLELINDCLKPKDVEKREHGEVFTPIEVINEMLDKLPAAVWKNKNLTWFDPAAGMGNFPIIIYLRLMDGLADEIPRAVKRKKHVLENMIYACELNKKNVIIYTQIFNLNNEFKLNLYCGDTLQFNPKIFRRDKFDVIVGNPPYNSGGIRSYTGKMLGKKNITLWPKFVEIAVSLLKPEGYMAFITPLSWLKKSHSCHDLLLDMQIIWLKLWDDSQSKFVLNADIPISLYLLGARVPKEKTEIISVLRRRNLKLYAHEFLNKKYSIPLAFHSIFNKLITWIEANNLQLKYYTRTVKSTGKKVKLNAVYSADDNLAVDTHIIKTGIMVKKASQAHPDADKKKLIIANKSSFAGAFIDDGRLSLTGSDKFYILGDSLEIILEMLKYKLIAVMCNYTRYRQHFLEKDIFTYLPDVRKLADIKNLDELKLYQLIGLSSEEMLSFGFKP